MNPNKDAGQLLEKNKETNCEEVFLMHHKILQKNIDGEIATERRIVFHCRETHRDSRSSVKQLRAPSLY